MADFEALIRDALAKQDASNPEIRKKVYQSSRNALERMISRAENASPEAAARQRQSLETSIRRIEADHAKPSQAQAGSAAQAAGKSELPVLRKVVEPSANSSAVRAPGQEPVATPPPSAVKPAPRTVEPVAPPVASQADRHDRGAGATAPKAPSAPEREPVLRREPQMEADEDLTVSHDAGLDNVELVDHADYDQYSENDFSAPPPELQRKRSWPLRWLVILIFMVLFFALGYYMYTVVITYVSDYNDKPLRKEDMVSEQGKGLRYIQILQPQDSSGLVVADRGTAEIQDAGGGKKLIRVQSIRPSNARNELAKPVLIELKPGVMQEIAGSEVTVEIQAKSGGSQPAQFSIECKFSESEDSDCGRKRFRVGPQPEAVVFKVDIAPGVADGKTAYLAINTDITKSANVSGEGELLDIYDVRIGMPEKQ